MRSKSSSINYRRANMSERADLGGIKMRVSMMWPDYRRMLFDNPDAMVVNPADIQDGRVMVLESNGETAGFTTLSPRGDGDMQLSFYLDPGHWGDAIVTRRLFQGAMDEARTQGGRKLWVLTTEAAVSFYESQGFDKVGAVDTAEGPRVQLTFDLLETIGNA